MWTTGGVVATTYYVYGLDGQLAAEYSSETPDVRWRYVFADLLGNIRAVSDDPSSGDASLIECYDYLPFGQQIQATDGSGNTRSGLACLNAANAATSKRFTGQERDEETNLDNFLARFFNSPQGRFLSPDWSETPTPIPYANLSNPQSLNLYAYVGNNPLNRVDPSGHCEGTAYMNLSLEEMGEIDRQCLKAGLFAEAIIFGGAAFYEAGTAVLEALPAVATAIWNRLARNPNKVQTTIKIAGDILAPPGPSPSVPPLRLEYENAVKGLADRIPELQRQGLNSEQIARTLHGARRELGETFKALTPPDKLAEIYARNLQRYGDKLGPTIEWLRSSGKSWGQIIESETRPGGKDLQF
jgi:RHS repeat-associated protein